MRVTNIEIHSGDVKLMDLNLRAPSANDRYLVKAIYGLDADEVVPRFYATSAADSTPFLRMGLKDREIVIRLSLSPSWGIGETYSELRDSLYRGISGSRSGLLRMLFKAAGASVAYADVTITKFEVPYSTEQSEVQITFACNDPLFRSDSETSYVSADFGSTGFVTVMDSTSTAPHGLLFDITFTGAPTSLIIQDNDIDPTWSFTVTPASAFANTDKLFINTEYGNRTVEHWPLGNENLAVSLLDRIAPGSVWPTIFPGENQFYFPGIPLTHLSAPNVTYTAAFWGV